MIGVKHLQMYFETEDDARAAAVDLQALGASQVTVDSRADLAIGFGSNKEDVDEINAFMLGAFPAGHTSSPAQASVPFALGEYTSGYSDEDELRSFVLTAVVDEAKLGDAVKAVKHHGGRRQSFGGYGER